MNETARAAAAPQQRRSSSLPHDKSVSAAQPQGPLSCELRHVTLVWIGACARHCCSKMVQGACFLKMHPLNQRVGRRGAAAPATGGSKGFAVCGRAPRPPA